MLTRHASIPSSASSSNLNSKQQQSQSVSKHSIQITRNSTRKQTNEFVENNNCFTDRDGGDYSSSDRNKRLKGSGGGGGGDLRQCSIDDNNNHHQKLNSNNNRKYNNSFSLLDNASSTQHFSSQQIGLLSHPQQTQSCTTTTTTSTSTKPLKKRWLASHENSEEKGENQDNQEQTTQNGHVITGNNQLSPISSTMSQSLDSELETIIVNLKENISKCNLNDWIDLNVLVRKTNSNQNFTYVHGHIYQINESIVTIKTKNTNVQELIHINLLNIYELFDIILDNLPVYTDLDVGKRVLCKLSIEHTQYSMGVIMDKTQQQFKIKLIDTEQTVLLARQSLRLILPPWHEEISIDWNLATELILTDKLSLSSSSIRTTVNEESSSMNNDLITMNSNAFRLRLLSTNDYSSSLNRQLSLSLSENLINVNVDDTIRTATATTSIITTEREQEELSNENVKKTLENNIQIIAKPSDDAQQTDNKNMFKKGDIVEAPNQIRKKFNGKQWRRLCSKDNCPKESQRKGLCSRHLSQKDKNSYQQTRPTPPQLLIPRYRHHPYHHSVSSSPVSTIPQYVRHIYDYSPATTSQHSNQTSFNRVNSFPNQQSELQQLFTTSKPTGLVPPGNAFNLHRGSYSAPHSRTATPMPHPSTITLTPLSLSTVTSRVNSHSSSSSLSPCEQQKQQQQRLLFIKDRSPSVQQQAHQQQYFHGEEQQTTSLLRDKENNGMSNIVNWPEILPKISIKVNTTISKVHRQANNEDSEDDDNVFPERCNSPRFNPQQQESPSSQHQLIERQQSQNNSNNQCLYTENKLPQSTSSIQQDTSRSLRPRNLSSHTNNTQNKSYIRRPMNSFMLFCKEQRPLMHLEHPNRDNRTVSKILGEKWYTLTKKERDKYKLLAKSLRQEHSKQNPDYKWSNGTRKQQSKEQKFPVEQAHERESDDEEDADAGSCENGDEKNMALHSQMEFRAQDEDDEQTLI
ncbi:unnamed protein product, partial [Didymodactylos carnosus]